MCWWAELHWYFDNFYICILQSSFPFFLQPHLFVSHPVTHWQPVISCFTRFLTSSMFSWLSHTTWISPFTISHSFPANGLKTSWARLASLHMCMTQQDLFQCSMRASLLGTISHSDFVRTHTVSYTLNPFTVLFLSWFCWKLHEVGEGWACVKTCAIFFETDGAH